MSTLEELDDLDRQGRDDKDKDKKDGSGDKDGNNNKAPGMEMQR